MRTVRHCEKSMKMLEDDLNGIESKLTKQFLKDSAFIYNQINEGQSQKASLIPKKAEIKKKVPDGQLPRKYKIDQLKKNLMKSTLSR